MIKIINDSQLFNGKIPPFFYNKITHDDWLKIKKEQYDDFKDKYISCPNDTIKKLYAEKGCKYIQISKKGLYHLGDDVCNLGVPEFICDQRLRIRTKIHRKTNKNGHCDLSVTCACQPINIKKMTNSKYSLDDINKLPDKLKYINVEKITCELNLIKISDIHDNDLVSPEFEQKHNKLMTEEKQVDKKLKK
jgi:hypothetical protein